MYFSAGELPDWLKGSLIRVGPGLFEVGDTSYQHWFDGLALLHRFSFGKGRVTYQNRFLRSDAYTKARKYNKIIYGEFGTMGIPDPCKSILERFASHFIPVATTDNNLINLYRIGDDLYTSSETHEPIRIDVNDLSTGPKVSEIEGGLGLLAGFLGLGLGLWLGLRLCPRLAKRLRRPDTLRMSSSRWPTQ